MASHFQQFTKLIDEFQEAKKNKLNDSNNEESDKNVKKRKTRQKRSYWHYLDSDDDEYEVIFVSFNYDVLNFRQNV